MRGKKATKRLLEPDYVYNSRMITRFVNRIMRDGKKSVAEKVMYSALEQIKKQTEKEPLQVFENALKNVSPKIEVKSRRIGGASYQVPMDVRGDRREALAIRWLIDAAKTKSNKEFHTMAEKLASELMDAANNTGIAIKKREDTHRMAEANRAFSHFRF
jgi:small subunit ribosomal protein S7